MLRSLMIPLIPLLGLAESPPTHLDPVPPHNWILLGPSYRKLIPRKDCVLWMLAAPSFEQHYSVAIVRSGDGAVPPSYEVKFSKVTQGFIINTAPAPAPSLDGSHNAVPEKPQKLRLFHASRAIPSPLAEKVIAAWGNEVKRTRYDSDQALHIGCDGCTYFFFFERFFFGTTWSPTEGRPKMMVDLASLLGEFAQTKGDDTSRVAQGIEGVCDRLNAGDIH